MNQRPPSRRGQRGPVVGSGARPSSAIAESSPRRPIALLWTSLGLLAAFILMAVAVAANPSAPLVQPLDDWWRSVVGVGPDSTAYTWFLPMLFQELGGPSGVVVLALVIIGLAAVGRWRSALFFLSMSLFCAGLLSQGVKRLVDRPRPTGDEALGLYGPLFGVDEGSFPSGHAIAAAGIAVGIAALIPPSRAAARRVWYIVSAALMLGMIWQRTLINAHWFTDTLFGLVASAGGALLMWWLFWPWLNQDYGRPVWFLHTRVQPKGVQAA